VAISAELFVAAFLNAATGQTQPVPSIRAVAETGWKSPAGRRQYVPVRLHGTPDGLSAQPVPNATGSHAVTALAEAEAWLIIPEAVTQVRPGDSFDLLI
jgi:molybdopterin molybdotransferase